MEYLFSLPEVNDNSLEFLSQNLCKPLEGFLDVKGKGVEPVTIRAPISFVSAQLPFVLSIHFVVDQLLATAVGLVLATMRQMTGC